MKSRKEKMEVGATPSSGNVFADISLPEPQEVLAKAEIAHEICVLIQRAKLSQVEAAKRLGIDQPKVSALMRGRLEGFSTERLFRFLNALGQDVEIVIRPVTARRAVAGVRVAVGM